MKISGAGVGGAGSAGNTSPAGGAFGGRAVFVHWPGAHRAGRSCSSHLLHLRQVLAHQGHWAWDESAQGWFVIDETQDGVIDAGSARKIV